MRLRSRYSMHKFLPVLLVISCMSARGQVPPNRVIDFNEHAWLAYAGDHPITDKWGLHFDGQWRRADLGTEWQQYQLRPGVNFHPTSKVMVTLGYAYTRNYPYGDFPVAAAFPEHRIYQQVLVRQRLRDIRVTHRGRMEQRFIRYPQNRDGSWTYQNRFRYLLKTEIPLTQENGTMRWYVPVFDEILIGIAPNYGTRPFDQNRFFVGVGRTLGKAGNLEFGYMNQFLAQRNGRIFEFNSTLWATFSSNLPIGKLFGLGQP